MSFQDELNEKSKTPQQVDDDIRKHMDVKACYEYSRIKEQMLSSVERGEFSSCGDKKRVVILYALHHNLADMVKEEDVPVQQSTGFLGLKTKTVVKKRIGVNPSKRKEYEYFIEGVKKYGREDGMEIVPIIWDKNEKCEYPIPTPVLGIYIWGCQFCLKCTMVY